LLLPHPADACLAGKPQLAARAMLRHPPREANQKNMNMKRILIVDDEPDISKVVKLTLENTGEYEVKVECRGMHALEATRAFRPHLLLLDVCLLDTDGGQVAAKVFSDPQLMHTPIIFMTSLVTPEETRNGPITNGGVPVLSKPFDGKILIACIEKTLADQSARATAAVSETRTSDTRMIKKNLLDRKRALESALSASTKG
jgi:DNA-binding response OmpR family regulator